MNEYNIYKRILSEEFKPDNQEELIEEGKQKATIYAKSNDITYTLYRYSFDEHKDKFLPFFNRKHNDLKNGKETDNPTPEGLLKFCDYILIAYCNERTYIILIEMKSGDSEGAALQLKATETFMEYIKSSAERVRNIDNECICFDSGNIITRKILLKNSKNRKQTTNINKDPKFKEIIEGKEPLYTNTFPLKKICVGQ